MIGILLVVFCLGNIVFLTQGTDKSRCAVVVFVNQSSFNEDGELTEYLKDIQGLSADQTNNVYFSNDPDTFKVKHGKFIDAPGLFALESEKYPGLFLRRANHSIVLEGEQPSETFKSDATFMMDHHERKESYTMFKLFSHRSWKLFSQPDSKGPLRFDISEGIAHHRTGLNLLIVSQPCMMHKDSSPRKVVASSKDKANVTKGDDKPGSGSITSDPTLNGPIDTTYVTAVTNKGKPNPLFNEYSFENFEVPDFILHSLVEQDKNAGDGMETSKTGFEPSADVSRDNYHHQQQQQQQQQQQIVDHPTKVPTTKQKINEMSNLMDENDMYDIEETLRDLQNGGKNCKLLVADDTMDENAALKDTVARPRKHTKKCIDEIPSSCEEMAKKGHCLAFKSLMSTVCRKSCNLCANLVDTGFTSCTKSCGRGRQMRMIKINHREYLQTRRCNTKPCPIDGGYSEFGNFTECSVTCGQGVKYRRRTCTRPPAQFNGKSCWRLGPSIDSEDCNVGVCPDAHHHNNLEMNGNSKQSSEHRKTNLHIVGPHSDNYVHEHSIILKGKKVAKLRCTPRKGKLRSIIQDAVTKRFIIHKSSKKDNTKRDNIEGDVLDKQGQVEESNNVVKAFKSPYKILLARKGPHNRKIVEECVETDENDDKSIPDDDTNSERDEEFFDGEISTTKSTKNHHKYKYKQIYTRPREKTYKDFDEYKYETGNVVTPQVAPSPYDYARESDYSVPSRKLFNDAFLNKINAVKPMVTDQLADEQELENENFSNGFPFNSQGAEHEGETDSVGRSGFDVVTTPDSNLMQSGGNSGNSRYNDGYEVESLTER